MLALPVILLAFSAAGDPAGILRRTAATYEKARSFEVTASLSVQIPGKDLIITTGQTVVYAAGEMLPADSPVPVLETGSVGGTPTFRNRAGQEVKDDLGGR